MARFGMASRAKTALTGDRFLRIVTGIALVIALPNSARALGISAPPPPSKAPEINLSTLAIEGVLVAVVITVFVLQRRRRLRKKP